MFKYKIELVGMNDIQKFVHSVSQSKGKVYIQDSIEGNKKRNAKSILGMLTTIRWENLYCVSEEDITTNIEEWIR